MRSFRTPKRPDLCTVSLRLRAVLRDSVPQSFCPGVWFILGCMRNPSAPCCQQSLQSWGAGEMWRLLLTQTLQLFLAGMWLLKYSPQGMPPTNFRTSGLRELGLRAVQVPVLAGSAFHAPFGIVSQPSCTHVEKAGVLGGIS